MNNTYSFHGLPDIGRIIEQNKEARSIVLWNVQGNALLLTRIPWHVVAMVAKAAPKVSAHWYKGGISFFESFSGSCDWLPYGWTGVVCPSSTVAWATASRAEAELQPRTVVEVQ